jgi:alpha-D-ribose 1-methylphosphonate 5-triphosphate diphosphatase
MEIQGNKRDTCLYGGPIFDGERLLGKGSILFSKEGIVQVLKGDDIPSARNSFNVHGRLIAPGLVDLHSDALEKCIEIRPGVYFDAEFALQNLDRRIVSCGITTFCHALSFADNELGLRSSERAESLVRLIRQYSQSRKSAVRHMVHARYEIGAKHGAEVIQRLLDERLIDAVSFMDHTPGQGQFRTLESFINYYAGTYKLTREEILHMVDHKKRTRELGWDKAIDLASRIREEHLPFLSHDDDSVEKVALLKEIGVTASEFPVCMEAAQAAKKSNMKVFMGAPNLIRGCSSNNHLKASDALKAGMCDALVSDYYPECLLQAPLTASKKYNINLYETLKLVTSNPGDYLKQRTVAGRLVIGAPADLIIVDHTGPWIRIAQTWVSGRCVYNSNPEMVEWLTQ